VNGKDYIMNRIRLSQERQAELDHERHKAEIRAQSNALIWNGTAEELTAAIVNWYESGKISAWDLQDALRKASIHFVRPEGMPAIQLSPPLSPAGIPSQRFLPLDSDCRVVVLDETQYSLSVYESKIIAVLYSAHKQGRKSVAIDEIRKGLGINSGKMSNWFRGANRPLKKIILHIGKQHYRLDF